VSTAFAFALAVSLSQGLATLATAGSQPAAGPHAGSATAAALMLLASAGSLALLGALWLSAAIEARSKASLARVTSALRQQSFSDPVTGLSNRQTFETRLAQAVKRADASQGRLALLFLDLDGFKAVNETYGHQRGDHMLQEIATRLRGELRACDAAARLGGDQFLVLLGDSPRADDVAAKASGLLAAMSKPSDVAAGDSAISCSIGIALYPMHGALSMLISHADAAMRAAKANGGGAYCFFEPHMVSGAREQVELLRDLRNALSLGQLELYYQPKVHGPSGEITGAEALMRWHHPLRGMISPTVFIPIAERFGLINTLGEWVIDEACRQARIWRDQGLRMRVAINLSVHQLRQPDFAGSIAAALAKYQVNPKLLTCEITESVAMEDSDHSMKVFSKLAEVGVHISIDDFGTGYSSLASLRKLPAEELKIDRSFVLDLETSADARAVVDAVVKLAQAIGLKVVAEGVETEQQHEILRSLGCHELQGYLFAKPMSAKALSLWAMGDAGPKSIAFRASLFSETVPSMQL
jgi:diguanylate cyclase (GGDEF)-like protein